jgi:hypothetical protein
VIALSDALGSAERPDAAGAAADGGRLDLLDPAYAWHPSDRDHAQAGLGHQATFAWRAKQPVSRFCLPGGAAGCAIEIVARSSCGDRLDIELNGQPLVSLRLGRQWTVDRVVVPPARLEPGGNQLAFRWPMPADTSGALHAMVDAWELARPADVYPVFGELARLRAIVA